MMKRVLNTITKEIFVFVSIGMLLLGTAGITSCSTPTGPDPDPRPKMHTVTINENYDNGLIYSTMVEHGSTITKPNDPSRAGWYFNWWCTDPEGANEYDFSSPVTEDITLYATWDNSVSLNNMSPEHYYTWDYFVSKVFEGDENSTKRVSFEKDGYKISIYWDSLSNGYKQIVYYYPQAETFTVDGTEYSGSYVEVTSQDSMLLFERASNNTLYIKNYNDPNDLMYMTSVINMNQNPYVRMSGEEAMEKVVAAGFGEVMILSYGSSYIEIGAGFNSSGNKLQFPEGKYRRVQ